MTSRILTFTIIVSMYMYVQIVNVTRHGILPFTLFPTVGLHRFLCVDVAFYSSRPRSNGIRTPNPKYHRFGIVSAIESSF